MTTSTKCEGLVIRVTTAKSKKTGNTITSEQRRKVRLAMNAMWGKMWECRQPYTTVSYGIYL